jgi:hypothetical protein
LQCDRKRRTELTPLALIGTQKTRRSNKSAGHTANIVNVVTFVEKARLLMHLLSPGRHFLFLVMSAIKTPAFFYAHYQTDKNLI